MSIDVKLNLSKLRRVIREEDAAIDRGVKRAAEYGGDLAQQLAPEDTGDLKDSKRVEQIEPGVYTISFGRGLPDKRAIFQEYGTRRMAAQPYLTPAVRQIDVAREIAIEMRELIR